jgi:GDP-4-dehydro-6-deoxy-D-mannose reductase
MPKVFITGANGGIGQRLKFALETNGNQVITPSNSEVRIEDPAYFDGIESPEQIEVLYHLAALSFVPKSWENPADFIRVNVLGTTQVLEFCRKYHIKMVYVSSYAYGIPDYLPIDENHPVSAANPYALSKIMGEDLCRFYGQNYGVNYTIVRPFNVYGSIDNKALLIPEIIEQIRFGSEIKVQDLTPKRDYVFIDDFIAFLILVKGKINNQIYNVGSGVSLSVAEIIETCQQVWNTHLPIISEKVARKNEIPETLCDTGKVKADFGWEPQYNFKQGIQAVKSRLENETIS